MRQQGLIKLIDVQVEIVDQWPLTLNVRELSS
jgi:hypothetical protein